MAPIWSVLANRKDKANQPFWTQYLVPAVDGCCPAQPGAIVLLGPDCKIDPCLLPSTSGLVIEINGVPSPCQSILNFIPGDGITITYEPDCGYLFTATGTTACGSAAFLCTDISGTEVEVDLSHPTHPGQLLISQPGNTSAIWADPQIQGLYPAGSTICPAPAYVPPTCIQPILVGGEDCNGVLQNFAVTTGGQVIVLAQDQETDINVLRFAATTGSTLVLNNTATLVPLLSIRPKVAATAVTFVAAIGDLSRFETPSQLMAYLGLVPSEQSSGAKVRRGGITKTGNSEARRMLVEAAWNYRYPARVAQEKSVIIVRQPKSIRDIAWKAQTRLCQRYRRLTALGKKPTVVVTAIARELSGFIWAIGKEVKLATV